MLFVVAQTLNHASMQTEEAVPGPSVLPTWLPVNDTRDARQEDLDRRIADLTLAIVETDEEIAALRKKQP